MPRCHAYSEGVHCSGINLGSLLLSFPSSDTLFLCTVKMPRATTVECASCPPLRALTFGTLGLINVVEAREKQGVPRVVERWGELDSSKSVMAVSMIDRNSHPLLAVARKIGQIEVLSPVNGDSQATFQMPMI